MDVSKFRSPWEDRCFFMPPKIDRKTGSWRTQRPVVKADKCCQCGWCYLYCPGGCVVDKGTYYEPDYEYCKGCGICAKECPISAIEMIIEEVQ